LKMTIPANGKSPTTNSKRWPAIWMLLFLIAGFFFGWPGWVNVNDEFQSYSRWLLIALFAPLIFCTVVRSVEHCKAMLGKWMAYFLSAPVLAILVGATTANVLIRLPGLVPKIPRDKLPLAPEAHSYIFYVIGMFLVPVILGFCLRKANERRKKSFIKPFINSLELLAKRLSSLTDLLVTFAPFFVGVVLAAKLHEGSVQNNKETLIDLFKLPIIELAGLGIFVLLGLGIAKAIFNIEPVKFLSAAKDAAWTGFLTASSQAALPRAIESMKTYCAEPRTTASTTLMLGTGTTVNLAGSALHLAACLIFFGLTTNPTLSIWRQAVMLGGVFLFSKMVAPVPRASQGVLVVLFASNAIPGSLMWLIICLDPLMDMMRTCVNVLANCMGAAIAVSRPNHCAGGLVSALRPLFRKVSTESQQWIEGATHVVAKVWCFSTSQIQKLVCQRRDYYQPVD
jgi:Na+/H+-dicarboxylate symporter